MKSETDQLEEALCFNDELIRDYAVDFESRRESKDRKDYKELMKDKNVFENGNSDEHQFFELMIN